MPTSTTQKIQQQRSRKTWRNLMGPDEPEPETLTRPEFVARLRADGIDVAPRTLAYWESVDVIPRSSREWHDGAPQSLYPLWMVDVVRTVRGMQAQGATLEHIREAVRMTPWRTPMTPPGDPPSTQEELVERFATYVRASENLGRQIAELARLRERAYGVRILDVALHFRDTDGATGVHGFGSPFGWLGDTTSKNDSAEYITQTE